MMLRESWRKMCHAAAVFTDWLLIGCGAVLMLTAFFRVNVPLAKWFVFASGLLFSGLGWRFRRRRLRRRD